MEQKRVSFKVAKAIKEAGYPQSDYDEMIGSITKPTYLDVWLWIMKETDILIDSECIRDDTFVGYRYMVQYPSECTYPKYIIEYSPYRYLTREEAIIAAIEYLVDKNLIK